MELPAEPALTLAESYDYPVCISITDWFGP